MKIAHRSPVRKPLAVIFVDMRPFIVLIMLTVITSCKRDIPAYDCDGVFYSCNNNIATDTSTAYSKIIGTWKLQGNIWYSRAREKPYCDKSQDVTLTFDSNRQVQQYIKGKLKCTSTYKIYTPVGINITSGCANGTLHVCDDYLTIIQSDRDGTDNYYTRVK